MKFLSSFAALAILASAAHVAADEVYFRPRPVLETKNGKLQGVETEGMVVYRNIPYAAPPVGELRWRPPQPVQNWAGLRDASRFGESCIQPWIQNLNNELVPGSEDCLKLNVYAPKGAKNRPVMVWFHGGGLLEGSSREPYYIPKGLVAEDVIVVTVDYRLGRFGFFAPKELIEEAKKNNEPVANYGIMDQIQSLKWVRDNIASFGGDPNNVTIFGQSAGGRSVTWLMTSPASKGLFHKAIAQSPQQLPMRDLTKTRDGKISAEDNDTKFQQSMGKSLQELRALPADQVMLDAQDFLKGGFDSSIIDGEIIIGDSIPLFAAGKQHAVPFMIGTLSWDASFFVLGAPPVEAYIKQMKQDPQIIKKLYASYKEQCDHALSAQIMADGWYTGAVKLLADSANKRAPSYAYYYDFMTPTLKSSYIGPAHTFELPYVFGDLDTVLRAPAKAPKTVNRCDKINEAYDAVKTTSAWSPYWFPVTAPHNKQDLSMKDQIAKSWTAFAKTGNPNYGGREIWPRYDMASDTMREFTNGKQGVVKNLNKDRVDYQLKFIKAMYQLP